MKVCTNCQTTVFDRRAEFCTECGGQLVTGNPPRRKWPWVVAGIVVTLAVTAVLGFYLWFGGPARAAKIVPESTDFFILCKPDAGQFRNFERIKEIYLSIPEVREYVDEWQDEMRKKCVIDFERDVKPWLGREAAFAIPSLDDLDMNEDPECLLAVATTDEAKAKACMNKVIDSLEIENISRATINYKDTTIIVISEEGFSDHIAWTVCDGFLLISNYKDLIYQTIDRMKNGSEENLANNEVYQKVMKQLPRSRAVSCYLDVRDLVGKLESQTQLDASEIGRLDAYQGVGLALSFMDVGVRVDYATVLNPEKLSNLTLDIKHSNGNLQESLQLAPAEVIAYVGSANLADSLKDLVQDLHHQPDFEEGLYEFKANTGIDIEDDVLALLNGEMSLAFVPDNPAWFEEVPLGFLFTAKVSDRWSAQSTLDKFASFLARDWDLQVTRETAAGREVCWVGEDCSGQRVGYCFDGNLLVIGSSEQVIGRALTRSRGALADNKVFKEAIKCHPSPYTECAFLNVPEGVRVLRDGLNDEGRQEFEEEVYPFVKPIDTVSLTARTYSRVLASETLVVRISER